MYDETRIAEEIVSVLGTGVARACSAERDSIRFTVRADEMKLQTIVLSRRSLRKLIDDPLRAVKVEYLQRDLLQSAGRRVEFKYPRVTFRSGGGPGAPRMGGGVVAPPVPARGLDFEGSVDARW